MLYLVDIPKGSMAFFFVIAVGLVCLSYDMLQSFYQQDMHSFQVQPSGYLRLKDSYRQNKSIVSAIKMTSSKPGLKAVPNSDRKLVSFDRFNPMQIYAGTLAKQVTVSTKTSQHINEKDLKYKLQKWTSAGFLYVRVTERYRGVLSVGGRNIHGTSISHLAGTYGDHGHGNSGLEKSGLRNSDPRNNGPRNSGPENSGPENSSDSNSGSGNSNVLSLCVFEDYFNGTYLVQCPLYSSNVDIQLITPQNLKVPLLRYNVRIPSSDLTMGQKPMNCWLHKGSTWYWYDEASRMIDLSVDKFCKAAASFNRLYFIGSSNMRYQYNYLLNTCAEKVPDIRKRAIYVFAIYGEDLNGVLHDMVESYSKKNCEGDGIPPFNTNMSRAEKCIYIFPHDNIPRGEPLQIYKYTTQAFKECSWLGAKNELKVDFCRPSSSRKIGIMTQTGAWNIAVNGNNKEFTDTFQHMFSKVLHNVSQTFGVSNNIRFLVMGPPAPAFNSQLILFGEVLRKTSDAHRVYYFPHAEMILPRYKEITDGPHYIKCKWRRPMDFTCNGTVGKAVARAAIIALDEQG